MLFNEKTSPDFLQLPIYLLVSHQFTVAYPLWLNISHTFHLIFFILRITSFKEENFAISFKCQNMCTNTIKEPTVVTDHHRTSCKIFQTFFKCTQCINIDIIGRLVAKAHCLFAPIVVANADGYVLLLTAYHTTFPDRNQRS